jgi:hypothetical protein
MDPENDAELAAAGLRQAQAVHEATASQEASCTEEEGGTEGSGRATIGADPNSKGNASRQDTNVPLAMGKVAG